MYFLPRADVYLLNCFDQSQEGTNKGNDRRMLEAKSFYISRVVSAFMKQNVRLGPVLQFRVCEFFYFL